MNQRLVPRYPTAQASQAIVNCAEPAAPAEFVAGAVFQHFTESNVFMQEPRDEAEGQGGAGEHRRAEGSQARLPSDRVENKPCATAVIAGATSTESCPAAALSGQDGTAPEDKPLAPGAVTLSIELSPAVALILKLATDAVGVSAGELIARAICIYAGRIGIPSLARAADDVGDDLHDLPQFVRRDQMRFSRAREALRNRTQGMRK